MRSTTNNASGRDSRYTNCTVTVGAMTRAFCGHVAGSGTVPPEGGDVEITLKLEVVGGGVGAVTASWQETQARGIRAKRIGLRTPVWLA